MSDDWNPLDPDATRVIYDLSRWSFDQQADLAAELADADIPHAWDGSDLVVPESHEALADSTLTRIEQQLGVVYDDSARPSATQSVMQPVDLPLDAATTEYELDEWVEADRQSLTRAITRQQIPYRWEDDVLLVATEFEAITESIMDLIEAGDLDADDDDIELPADHDAERLPFETLSTFFLAGHRLRRNPLDADGLEQLLAAVAVAEPSEPPYGVELRLWQRTCELADELAGALVDHDEPDHDEATAVAAELHDLLRPYV